MKSQQFNEADPCFPEGTYNGITNEGYIKCTCGSNNQYCSTTLVNDGGTCRWCNPLDLELLILLSGITNLFVDEEFFT